MQDERENAIQDYYPDDFAWCYGCGRLNEKGHHFRTTWEGEKTLTVFMPKPEHIAVHGFVYGGLVASLIDCHGSGSSSLAFCRKNGREIKAGMEAPRFVTASLHVNYLKPTPHNVPLKAFGIVEEIHPKRWKIDTEVFADDVLCATGEFVGVVMPKTFGKSS